MEAFKKPNIAINPPIRLNKPKSLGPKAAKTKRVTYNDKKIVIAILA
jgi:hypothetical protein